ncbi:MAG: hypothetical protein P8Z70_04055 [Desulfuromonadales bacterium]
MKNWATLWGLLLAAGMLTWAFGCASAANREQPIQASPGNISTVNTQAAKETPPQELPLLQKWSGDYPVFDLDRLPADQREVHGGYIGNAAEFANLWQAFKPEDPLPEVDFDRNLVVFIRNTTFYNHVNIFKVTLRDGVAEVLAMETLSALPNEDKVAMALAVIPRAGIRFIAVGEDRIAVKGD